MNKICLYGASGHGKVVMDIANSCNFQIEVFFDDAPKQEVINGVFVLKSKDINSYWKSKFLVSIGDNLIRKQVSIKIVNSFVTLIHKRSIISPSSEILEGTVIMANAVVNADAKIGRHVIINTTAVIEHDCLIDDYVHISPNATITGNVKVGEGTHVGAGATVLPNIIIGKWVIIGAGAVITKDIPDYAVVIGNPGEIIKYNNNEE